MLEDDLSEQHLMDCGYDGETMIGCDGAFVFAYVEWIIWNNDGLVEKVSDDNDILMIRIMILFTGTILKLSYFKRGTPPLCLKVNGGVEPESKYVEEPESICGGPHDFSVSAVPL